MIVHISHVFVDTPAMAAAAKTADLGFYCGKCAWHTMPKLIIKNGAPYDKCNRCGTETLALDEAKEVIYKCSFALDPDSGLVDRTRIQHVVVYAPPGSAIQVGHSYVVSVFDAVTKK